MAKKKSKKPEKPKLPRFSMPPPEKLHRDEKKERSRTACRKFRARLSEE
jgi:c-di-GMP-binding flagellar brake protein YcgR